MVEVIGIAILSGIIGMMLGLKIGWRDVKKAVMILTYQDIMMLGLKIGWRDAKRLYDPYLPGYKDER